LTPFPLTKPRAKPKPKGTVIPKPASELEETLLLQLRVAGFPIPEREYPFPNKTRHRWRWDFSWNDIMLAVEVQGGLHLKRGAHNTAAGITRDIEKANEAILLGWTVIHCTKDHIDSGQAVQWIERAWARLV
jgi:hypothetical protein